MEKARQDWHLQGGANLVHYPNQLLTPVAKDILKRNHDLQIRQQKLIFEMQDIINGSKELDGLCQYMLGSGTETLTTAADITGIESRSTGARRRELMGCVDDPNAQAMASMAVNALDDANDRATNAFQHCRPNTRAYLAELGSLFTQGLTHRYPPKRDFIRQLANQKYKPDYQGFNEKYPIDWDNANRYYRTGSTSSRSRGSHWAAGGQMKRQSTEPLAGRSPKQARLASPKLPASEGQPRSESHDKRQGPPEGVARDEHGRYYLYETAYRGALSRLQQKTPLPGKEDTLFRTALMTWHWWNCNPDGGTPVWTALPYESKTPSPPIEEDKFKYVWFEGPKGWDEDCQMWLDVNKEQFSVDYAW